LDAVALDRSDVFLVANAAEVTQGKPCNLRFLKGLLMKRCVLITILAIGLGCLGFRAVRKQAMHDGSVTNPPTSPLPAKADAALPTSPQFAATAPTATPAETASVPPPAANPAPAAVSPAAAPRNELQQTIDVLVSPQTTFQQKQALWQQLREASKLDQVISALKQGAADNASVLAYPLALGEAYINKIPTVRGFNETSILGIEADKSFDAALTLDPSNWEAQFFKAAALARWPAELNRGDEAIQRLSSLIDQQDKQQSRPEFAQTYVVLGNEFQQTGQADKAQATWVLGLQKFPNNPSLQSKVKGR
jgi:hypothetical protein